MRTMKMGQGFWLDSVGTQGFPGQSYGQNMELGRRRVGRNQLGGLGPTEVAGNHHQRVVVAD